ncbi:MAG: pyridoxamine 5'-phosphate oxidase family protein [Acidimicrobiales bacterium]
MWLDHAGSEILERPECLRLLALGAKQQLVGRVGFVVPHPDGSTHAPIILPVNFAQVEGELVVRSGEGLKSSATDGALVAFEVDSADHVEQVAWSVLVRGLGTVWHPDQMAPEDLGRLPHPLVPRAGDRLLHIRADLVTGRRFALHGAATEPEH